MRDALRHARLQAILYGPRSHEAMLSRKTAQIAATRAFSMVATAPHTSPQVQAASDSEASLAVAVAGAGGTSTLAREAPPGCVGAVSFSVAESRVPSVEVVRARRAVAEVQGTLSALQNRGAVSVPDITRAVCEATKRATAPGAPRPPSRGRADDLASVMEGTPFPLSPPGPWAAGGRRPGDLHAGPLCTCGRHRCDQGHFPVVDVFEVYDMHCQYDCGAHEQNACASYVYPEAHATCVIHTILTLVSGVTVPLKSPDSVPREASVARRIAVDPESEDGLFVTAQIEKGLSLDLIEELSAAQIADPSECLIVDAAFVALSGDMKLSPEEAAAVGSPSTPIPVLNSLCKARARSLIGGLMLRATPSADGIREVDKRTVALEWERQGGGDKRRLCIAHNRLLNNLSDGWPISFTTPYAVLETAQPGDVYVKRDHKGGFNVVVIHPAFRRFFCFICPVTGKFYRSKRLTFGWVLSPSVFCSFTAVINSIIAARMAVEIHPRCTSAYYIDDCLTSTPSGGGAALAIPPSMSDSPLLQRAQSANVSRTVIILIEVQRRAGFPTASEKDDVGESLAFLGVRIDSATRSAVVLSPKIFKTLTMIHFLILVAEEARSYRIIVPRSFVLKCAGSTQWLAEIFRSGRLHTPALWRAAELLRLRSPPSVSDLPNFVSTLQWWAEAASSGRLLPHRFIVALDIPSLDLFFDWVSSASDVVPAVPVSLAQPSATRPVVSLLSDAAGGCAVGGCWTCDRGGSVRAFFAPLSPEERAWPAIDAKELKALVVWLESFGHEHEGAVLLYGTDNAGNVFTINRLRVDASNTVTQKLLSRMLAAADQWGIDIIAWWCPRALNAISDSLSKSLSLADARRVARTFGVVLLDTPADIPAFL